MSYLRTYYVAVITSIFYLGITQTACAQSVDSSPHASTTSTATPIPQVITPVLHKREKPIGTQNSYFRFELANIEGGNTLLIKDANSTGSDRLKAAIRNYFYGRNQSLVTTFTPSIAGKTLPKQVLFVWTDNGSNQTSEHGVAQLSPLFREQGPISLDFGAQYTDDVHSNLVSAIFTVIQTGVSVWGAPTSLFSNISADKYQKAGEKIDNAINKAFSERRTPVVPVSIDLSVDDRIDLVTNDGNVTQTLLSIVITPQDSLWGSSYNNLPDTPPQIMAKPVDSDKKVSQLLTTDNDSWAKFNNAKGKEDIPSIRAFCSDLVNTLASNGLTPLDSAIVLYGVLYQSPWNSNPKLRGNNDPCELNTQVLAGTNLEGKLHPRSYLLREAQKRRIALENMQDSVFNDIPIALQTRTATAWREMLAPSVAISVEGGAFNIGKNVTISTGAPRILPAKQAASLLAEMPVSYQPSTACFQLYEQVASMTFFTQCIQAQDSAVVIKKVDLTFDRSFADDSGTDEDATPLLTAIRFYL